MNIRDLKYITVLAKERHFAKAAAKVFVSQPTLSMQIKKLEDDLGVEIFERARGDIFVTKVGEGIIKKAEIILREVEEIKNIAKNSQDLFASSFAIAAFPTLASYFFPKAIGKIHKKFPELKLLLIEEKTEILIKKLKNAEIDVALLASPILEEDFDSIKIFEEDFFLAVSKKHKFAKCKKIYSKDLKGEQLMLLEDGHCLRKQALEICSLIGAFEHQEFRATSLETLRQMVEIDAGITLIPEIAIKKSNKISYIKLIPSPKREIRLYFRKSASNKALIDILANEIRCFG
jgi:LysR family hydrogen peroxide-inducible transcriptional activator